eukprot:CAMPEP_0202471160 /NCGR_PEP_ID=MMETSP1360-20130828/83803_1 /ASSEMBLY_ACC=CAM_ASM_000848 /TAXON_ID=515479 /ORGANISM="Licmophora paradoxa, Strain CCMP2313" /LENGTH=411 /DNA_ID=CAMNT_0049097133 /DNA_START=97 /DNA_END=1332 /DNA_ORIENTATION=+
MDPVAATKGNNTEAQNKLYETIIEDGIITRIASVATAFPDSVYTQQEVKEMLAVENKTVHKLLNAPHIETRALYFNKKTDSEGNITPLDYETQEDLHAKFINGLEQTGVQCAKNAIAEAQLTIEDIDVIIAVTSSGLALPGFSGILTRDLQARTDIHRFDIVGMGCCAGMSGFRSAYQTVRELSRRTNRPIRGLMVCCEINSAIYINNEETGVGIVNSLFGDGAAALIIDSRKNTEHPLSLPAPSTNEKMPSVAMVDFELVTITEFFDDMIYRMDSDQQKLNFKLSKKIPFVVGDAAPKLVKKLLDRNEIPPSAVRHWSVHTGGAKVIEGFAKGLGLDEEVDMIHTKTVLRDYGNISSGSFIVSFQRLVEMSNENSTEERHSINQGDIMVFVAMGPGATIEAGIGIATKGC